MFESDYIAQNGSKDSLRILGLILEELDEGLFVAFFRQVRENEKEV